MDCTTIREERQPIGALNVTAGYIRRISYASSTSLKVRVAYGYSIRRASDGTDVD